MLAFWTGFWLAVEAIKTKERIFDFFKIKGGIMAKIKYVNSKLKQKTEKKNKNEQKQ